MNTANHQSNLLSCNSFLYNIFLSLGMFSLAFLGGRSFAQQQVFTTVGSNTFTTHQSVIELTAEAVGGGGGGADLRGSGSSSQRWSAGGGGGAYARGKVPVTSSTTYPVNVGIGGPRNSTTWGGNSSFGANLVMAEGGESIQRGDRQQHTPGRGGLAGNSVGNQAVWSGGTGGTGSNRSAGGGGGAAGSTGNGDNGYRTSSNTNCGTANNGGGYPGPGALMTGGTHPLGRGGKGGDSGSGGGNGCSYGGGGGGASSSGFSNHDGGSGFQGIVIVTWSQIDNLSPANICANSATNVTIDGLNFVNVSSVTLNGNPLTHNVISTTQITATIPMGAAAGNIIVATQYGMAQVPIVIGINLVAGPASSTPTLCIHTPLTPITHSTTGATGIGTPVGLPPGVSASWAADLVTISGTPTSAGTFSYTIPLSGGCGSADVTGTIIVTDDNTVSSASASPILCLNTPLTNITHNTTGATGIGAPSGLPSGVTAAWNSNVITISGTPTDEGTFTYSIPLTGGCGTVNATGTITVNGIPTVSAIASQTLCAGSPSSPVSFSGAVIPGTSYDWTNDNPSIGLPASGTGDIDSFTVVNGTTNQTTATISVTPVANGCSGPSESFTITVNPLPVANTPANQILCNGTPSQSITFSSNISGSSYTWINSNPNIGLPASGNGNINSFTASNSGNSPITATITVIPSVNSCQGNPTTFSITVEPTPSVTFMADNDVCASESILFSNNSSGAISFAWNFGDGSSSSLQNTNHTYPTTAAIYTVTLQVTFLNGCVGSHSQTITVLPTPSAAFDVNPSTVEITNATVTFNNQSTNDLTWLWDFGDGNSSTSQNPSHTYTAPGQYSVVLVAENSSCFDTATFVILVNDVVSLPNVFTPNGDGINDLFGINSTLVSEVEFIIFNRWGATVFETKDANLHWDGKVNGQDASEGVYFYVVRVKKTDGETQDHKGSVTLIR